MLFFAVEIAYKVVSLSAYKKCSHNLTINLQNHFHLTIDQFEYGPKTEINQSEIAAMVLS
jgi:hypothetical protein